MKRQFTTFLVAAVFAAVAPPAHAQESADQVAIRHKLVQMFDKSDARLTLDAIVVAGDAAIADWEQGGSGGRALLRQRHGNWTIILCSGDEITAAAALVKVGLQNEQAEHLASALAITEAALPKERLATLARFEGIVVVGGTERSEAHKR